MYSNMESPLMATIKKEDFSLLLNDIDFTAILAPSTKWFTYLLTYLKRVCRLYLMASTFMPRFIGVVTGMGGEVGASVPKGREKNLGVIYR